MSEVAAEDAKTQAADEQKLVSVWKQRIQESRADRLRFEGTWHRNLAFAAGRHDVVWDRFSRELVVDPELEDREIYQADIITEQRAGALGELEADDDRPELLLVSDGAAAQQAQVQINKAIGHGWEHEWDGDDAILQMRRFLLDMGTAAIRARFDPTRGPLKQGNVPTVNGKPVLDIGAASKLFENGPNPSVQMRQIHEGRHSWEPLSSFNILTPPGIFHEKNFDWEVVVRPYPIDSVQEEFGEKAAGLTEDGDIGSILGISAREERSAVGYAGDSTSNGRLRGHVWLYTCYQRPNRQNPKGQVVHLASNEMRLLRVDPELPYSTCEGEYRSGIAYFHYWRLNDRFWSKAFIEGLIDPQRVMDEVSTLNVEIIKRGLPFVLVPKGSEAGEREGKPVEVIEIDWDGQHGAPVLSQGIGPGEWMFRMRQELRDDAAHASTLSALRLGENPANVNTYSQLALLNENEATKRKPIYDEHRSSLKRLVEAAVHDIRKYWGDKKQILLAGEEGQVQAEQFNSQVIPDFYVVRIPKGATKPRSQAAELKKVEDVAQYSTNTGQPLPTHWLKASLDAGEALELPDVPTDAHAEKAHLENQKMFEGREPPVAYYDPALTHIPIHREGQVRAELAGDMDTWHRIEQHVQEHLQVTQQNMVANAQHTPPVPPVAPAPAGGPAAPAQPAPAQ